MTTERIDIVIREDGSRVVVRNLDNIGARAERTAGAVDFLKRALTGIGAGLAIREVLQLADSYTNLQNRLRATGLEGSALTSVYQRLLQVSNDTRSSVQGSVELYSRLAVSSKELGVNQQQLIDFTKSLNQAVLLSGASAHEAEAAIIQLSQGMASGTLRGDELRSVMEQLPAVADVIAKQMGVTRGELRKMGEDGKITAQTILKAFQSARAELEERFAKTVPTLSQSFQVLKNNVIDFVGRMDDALGITRAISEVIFKIANNLDAIADAFKRVGIQVATFLVAYGTLRASLAVGAFAVAIQEAMAFRQAVAAGTVVVLGSAEAERQRAAAALESAVAAQQATALQTAATVQNARSSVVASEAALAEVAARQATIIAVREEAVAKLAKVNIDLAQAKAAQTAAQAAGAQSFALATLRTATIQAAAAEEARAVILTELAALGRAQVSVSAQQTAALTTQAAAQEALNVATAQAATTNAAAAASAGAAATRAATAAAAAAGTTSLWAQAMAGLRTVVGAVWSQVSRLFLLLNAHPFTALAVAITLVVGTLLGFGDKLDAGIDGITTMQDVLGALGETAVEVFKDLKFLVGDAFSTVVDTVGSVMDGVTSVISAAIPDWMKSFGGFFDGVGTGFAGFVRGTARVFDTLGGVVYGAVLFITRAFGGLPEVLIGTFKRAYNGVVDVIESLVNTVVDGVNAVRGALGKPLIANVQFDKLDINEQTFEQYGKNLSVSIVDGMESQGGALEKAVNSVFDRAQQRSRERGAELFRAGEKDRTPLDTANPAVAVKTPVDEKAMKKLQRALDSLISTIAPMDAAVADFAAGLSVLHESFAKGLINSEQYGRYVQLLGEHYRDILDPLGKLNREIDQQTGLLALNSREREIEQQLIDATNDLKKQGKILDAQETAALRAKLQGFQALNEAVQTQDALLEESVEKRRKYVIQLEQIQALLANPASGFTKLDALRTVVSEVGADTLRGTKAEIDLAIGALQEVYDKIDGARKAGLLSPDDATKAQNNATFEYKSQLQSANAELFDGTQEQIDLNLDRFKRMYEQIDVLRAEDQISAQTQAQMKLKVDAMVHEQQLQNATNFFGTLANLSNSNSKELAAIGKAAAITQATIDGVLAVQKALASSPPPFNYAMAAAVGTVAAANVAKIAGFQDGGYTGNDAVNKVSGVVHGKEFVVNADGTRKNRELLEMANQGIDLSSMMAGYQTGGYAAPQAASYVAPTTPPTPSAAPAVAPASPAAGGGAQLNARIVNVLDPALISDYLQSSEGEQLFVNVMRRNSDQVRTVFQEG